MSELSHVAVIVHGHVQGVFYRVFVSRVAKSLGMRGYVQNLPRGGVEIKAEGDKAKLEELVRQLELGPPEALVEKVDVQWSEFTGQFVKFEVRS